MKNFKFLKNDNPRTFYIDKRFLAFLIVALLILYCFFSNFNRKKEYSITSYTLGTVNTVTVYNIGKKKSNKVLKECEYILNDITNKMSLNLMSSEINKINSQAGISDVKVSDDVFFVISKALSYSEISPDTFDISIGSVSDLWEIGTDKARVPSREEIDSVLPLVSYKNIQIDEKEKTVKLLKKGMKIDLGAIAKGYAADKIHEYLISQNVASALINLGGNIYVQGNTAKDDAYNVGIQDPQGDNKTVIGSIDGIVNMTVVTSGIYQRFIEKDGKIYHHILNPRTGYPIDNNLNSVTIITKKSIDADALSTTIYGMGLEKGLEYINKNQYIDAVFVTKDKKIYITNGIKNKFRLLSNEYELKE
ncbi:MAG: FAD:protein FMN transferase [Clostridioides sp.]|jgi:thiamine biosynthesis lipoprotein|nr:FAD:protein FMN transferase [Clostridioides sp.]